MKKKKQRAPKQKSNFYVVFAGKIPGVYSHHETAMQQLDGFPDAKLRGYQKLLPAMAAFENGRKDDKIVLPFCEVKSRKEYESDWDFKTDLYNSKHVSYEIRRVEPHRLIYYPYDKIETIHIDSYCNIVFQRYTINSYKMINPELLLDLPSFHKQLLFGFCRNKLGIFCITECMNGGAGGDMQRVLYFNKARFDKFLQGK